MGFRKLRRKFKGFEKPINQMQPSPPFNQMQQDPIISPVYCLEVMFAEHIRIARETKAHDVEKEQEQTEKPKEQDKDAGE